MATQVLIDAQKIGLSVPVYQAQERSILKNPLSLLADFYVGGESRTNRQLLENITFTLEAGDRMALIGENGAGKSTLLRVVGGIYRPTSGSLTLNCTPKGLFDIALGFQPDATGLENIYLRGLEMGMTMADVRLRLPEIIDFSGLGDHIDKAFNSYSAGMRLRLVVAIALSVQPDVMLLDEWIGAGDATFQAKVTARMNELVQGARGLMLASHNDVLLKRVCTRGMVLDHGSCVFVGPLNEALAHYHEKIRPMRKDTAENTSAVRPGPPKVASGG